MTAEIPAQFTPANHETVLEEASRLVYGDREHDYGHPMDEVARIEAHLVALQEAVTERQAMLEAQQRELARLRAQKDCS